MKDKDEDERQKDERQKSKKDKNMSQTERIDKKTRKK